uniref:Pacifastin domain-containing protein n=1 Tax=Heterorhabditis bacteriophora TaxID=37862 RepID=A0A1I7XVE6_HETBA
MQKASGGASTQQALESAEIGDKRKRRGTDNKGVWEPANSVCNCDEDSDEECEADSEKENWMNTTCQYCDDHKYCNRKAKTGVLHNNTRCLCERGETFCIMYDQNMTDEVAIVTKAKENIIFAMSALSEQQRRDMSQAKHNLIHKCSFNGKPCDIDKLAKYPKYF